jgi:hypothetical protein
MCVEEYVTSAAAMAGATCPTCSRPLSVDLSDPDAAPAKPSPSPGAKRGRGGGGGGGGGGPAGFKKSSILSRIDAAAFQSSTKLEALHEEIRAMLRADASAKCIVFSQFTSMLDLIQFRMQQVRLGLLGRPPRSAAVDEPVVSKCATLPSDAWLGQSVAPASTSHAKMSSAKLHCRCARSRVLRGTPCSSTT